VGYHLVVFDVVVPRVKASAMAHFPLFSKCKTTTMMQWESSNRGGIAEGQLPFEGELHRLPPRRHLPQQEREKVGHAREEEVVAALEKKSSSTTAASTEPSLT
jgi:hypothetical protein